MTKYEAQLRAAEDARRAIVNTHITAIAQYGTLAKKIKSTNRPDSEGKLAAHCGEGTDPEARPTEIEKAQSKIRATEKFLTLVYSKIQKLIKEMEGSVPPNKKTVTATEDGATSTMGLQFETDEAAMKYLLQAKKWAESHNIKIEFAVTTDDEKLKLAKHHLNVVSHQLEAAKSNLARFRLEEKEKKATAMEGVVEEGVDRHPKAPRFVPYVRVRRH